MISPSTANHRPLQSTASPVATTTTPAAAPALGTIPTSSRPSSRLQSPGTSSPFFHAVPAVRRHPARQLLRRSRPVLYCGIALLSRQGSCASDTAWRSRPPRFALKSKLSPLARSQLAGGCWTSGVRWAQRTPSPTAGYRQGPVPACYYKKTTLGFACFAAIKWSSRSPRGNAIQGVIIERPTAF